MPPRPNISNRNLAGIKKIRFKKLRKGESSGKALHERTESQNLTAEQSHPAKRQQQEDTGDDDDDKEPIKFDFSERLDVQETVEESIEQWEDPLVSRSLFEGDCLTADRMLMR
jgi:hypothetical protein